MKERLIIVLMLFSQLATSQNKDFVPEYKYETRKMAISDDIEMAYVEEGKKNAPVLLMVHGLGGYIKNWYSTIDGLKADYRCIAIDLPGYGQSTIKDFGHDDYMEFFAQSILTFVKKKKLKKVTLVGHSMGGQVSTVVALKQPKWLDKLVLAAPAGFETFTKEEGSVLRKYASAGAIMKQEEAQIRAAHKINFVDMPELGEELIKDRIQTKATSYFKDYALVREMGVRGMLDHPVQKDLEKINVPTLVIFGANDLLIPNRFLHAGLTTKQVAETGKKIPNVKIEMIENAGHMLQMDNPEAFNQLLKQTLTN